MEKHDIDRFVGDWASSLGYRLTIRKRGAKRAAVSVFTPVGNPVRRDYMDGAPAVDLDATYDEYSGDFRVELWRAGRGFHLELTYEAVSEREPRGREVLIPAFSRYEQDGHLDGCFAAFGGLKDFFREAIQALDPTRVSRPEIGQIPED